MGFERYFLEQLHRHPSMKAQDVVKMCYQAAFGAEHLLQDKARAEAYFMKEYEETEAKEMPLYEEISENICRVNLAAWKYHSLPAAWLFRIFAASCGKREGGEELFYSYLKQAEALLVETLISQEEWQIYLAEYEKKGLSPVHHSDNYREKEHPAYRIVDRKYIRLLPILQKAAEKMQEKDVVVIAIDGRAASGKTTATGYLQEILSAEVIRMDDFFLPMELRTPERFAQPGGNVHQERFMEEVLPFLSQEKAFSYQIFDCGRMDYHGNQEISVGKFRIVEGSYSCHPVFGRYADVVVFSDVDAEEQMERICIRNGEKMAEMFRTRWIPLEEAYFTAYDIAVKADIILK